MLEDLIEKYTAKADKTSTFLSSFGIGMGILLMKNFLKEAIGNLVDISIKYSG